MQKEIRVGASSCLLGNPVRYDGGHKHDHYITDALGSYFTLVPVCPEVECGMSVPREAMRLIGDPKNPRLVTSKSGHDMSEQMLRYCSDKAALLENEDLCGFIFKKNSPSSGLHRVKVYNPKGGAPKSGRGLFAASVTARFPLLPVEEEGRLKDPRLRENFIERVFCFRRWKDFIASGGSYKELPGFHARHKLQLMAHSPIHLSRMGKLVAEGKSIGAAELLQRYESELMEALALKATVKKNVNVLQHMAGYFKKLVDGDEKKELQELIDRYAQGLVPLVVPMTLVNHYVRKFDIAYLKGQSYLEPHPSELMLRNQV